MAGAIGVVGVVVFAATVEERYTSCPGRYEAPAPTRRVNRSLQSTRPGSPSRCVLEAFPALPRLEILHLEAAGFAGQARGTECAE
jgi:hypothetical protein